MYENKYMSVFCLVDIVSLCWHFMQTGLKIEGRYSYSQETVNKTESSHTLPLTLEKMLLSVGYFC